MHSPGEPRLGGVYLLACGTWLALRGRLIRKQLASAYLNSSKHGMTLLQRSLNRCKSKKNNCANLDTAARRFSSHLTSMQRFWDSNLKRTWPEQRNGKQERVRVFLYRMRAIYFHEITWLCFRISTQPPMRAKITRFFPSDASLQEVSPDIAFAMHKLCRPALLRGQLAMRDHNKCTNNECEKKNQNKMV